AAPRSFGSGQMSLGLVRSGFTGEPRGRHGVLSEDLPGDYLPVGEDPLGFTGEEFEDCRFHCETLSLRFHGHRSGRPRHIRNLVTAEVVGFRMSSRMVARMAPGRGAHEILKP